MSKRETRKQQCAGAYVDEYVHLYIYIYISLGVRIQDSTIPLVLCFAEGFSDG